ncbi:hypothetical protein [Gimibacter soli]|uniref:DUF1499 domain-containing protein n=1 Tax=Gimibacter soli TaxID=3024400 RepID=A0AAE9XRM3_9PROT|nr:hypothetical protein [Gimibacter soli]WCL54997.1 hypothetical protein PH603_04395 [Gimibacter soli]
MIDRFRQIAIFVSLIVVVGLVVLYMMVQMGGGDTLFGDREGNLEPVDFATLAYMPDQNGFLMCDEATCTAAAADGPTLRFEADAARLRQVLADFTDDNPTVRTHRFDLATSQFDFLERLPGADFPAVVTVQVIDMGPGLSGLVMYSRQPIGDSSKADHADRMARWSRMLNERLAR